MKVYCKDAAADLGELLQVKTGGAGRQRGLSNGLGKAGRWRSKRADVVDTGLVNVQANMQGKHELE